MSENTEKLLKDVSAQLKEVGDKVKSTAEESQNQIKNLGNVTNETKAKADELLSKHSEVAARVEELEQQLARRANGDAQKPQTPGRQFISNEETKKFLAKPAGNFRLDVQNLITSSTADADGSAGALVTPQRVDGIFAAPERRMTVRDLLTPGSTDSNAITYVQEVGFTNAAAIVAEGNLKPSSSLQFEDVTQAVVTIAHGIPASKQILDDAPQLMSYIDGRLRYGLKYVEEAQLLNGSGTGGNLKGIYTAASSYSPAFELTGETNIDTIRLAILQAFLAEYPATGVVLNPIDWARIELTKTDDGQYIFANPQRYNAPGLWGLPVVETQAITVDKFLVGAFKLGAQIFDRQDATVEIATQHSDDFMKNKIMIRAEERLALAIYRPESFVKGDLGNVA